MSNFHRGNPASALREAVDTAQRELRTDASDRAELLLVDETGTPYAAPPESGPDCPYRRAHTAPENAERNQLVALRWIWAQFQRTRYCPTDRPTAELIEPTALSRRGEKGRLPPLDLLAYAVKIGIVNLIAGIEPRGWAPDSLRI